MTGSLGVVMLTVNAQGLMDKIRVAPLAIKSGPMKDAGSPFRALTQPEPQVFQGVIDDMYGRFVRLIAESRKIPEERVRSFADGRIYTAQQALALGLVDRIAYLDDVVGTTKKMLGVDEARVVMYHRPREYRATIYSEAARRSPARAAPSGSSRASSAGPGPASCTSGGPESRMLKGPSASVGPRQPLNVERLRLAGCLRPPRISTFLSILRSRTHPLLRRLYVFVPLDPRSW